MGPRSFNRGRYISVEGVDFKNLASMGPRSFNRGRSRPADTVGMFSSSFNGASVFQPRKVARRELQAIRPAMLQWGLGLSTEEGGDLVGRILNAVDASMGPRSFNRGRLRGAVQGGCGCIASMGPRSFNRGRDCTETAAQNIEGASMGPRSFNRGRVPLLGRPGGDLQASMGPRSFNRGRSPRHNLSADNKLQGRFREVVSDMDSKEAPSTRPFSKYCRINTLRMREVPGVCSPQDLSNHEIRKKTR